MLIAQRIRLLQCVSKVSSIIRVKETPVAEVDPRIWSRRNSEVFRRFINGT